jgi:hypothetical protein
MVPRDQLERTEQHLMTHGWEPLEIDVYDRRTTYDGAMSCRPCAIASARGTELDVHHTILPPLSRLRPDPAAFWRSAVTLRDGSRALCPTHMALHVAVHLFQEGVIAGGLGGLIDFAEMCRDLVGTPIFGQNWCLQPSSSCSSDRSITLCVTLPRCSEQQFRTQSWPRPAGSTGRPRRCAL